MKNRYFSLTNQIMFVTSRFQNNIVMVCCTCSTWHATLLPRATNRAFSVQHARYNATQLWLVSYHGHTHTWFRTSWLTWPRLFDAIGTLKIYIGPNMIVCIGVKQQLRKICNGGGIDSTVYSKCFAGKARRRSMCTYCLSDNHTSQECHDDPANISWP